MGGENGSGKVPVGVGLTADEERALMTESGTYSVAFLQRPDLDEEEEDEEVGLGLGRGYTSGWRVTFLGTVTFLGACVHPATWSCTHGRCRILLSPSLHFCGETSMGMY
jgi:hypothetical protein